MSSEWVVDLLLIQRLGVTVDDEDILVHFLEVVDYIGHNLHFVHPPSQADVPAVPQVEEDLLKDLNFGVIGVSILDLFVLVLLLSLQVYKILVKFLVPKQLNSVLILLIGC